MITMKADKAETPGYVVAFYDSRVETARSVFLVYADDAQSAVNRFVRWACRKFRGFNVVSEASYVRAFRLPIGVDEPTQADCWALANSTVDLPALEQTREFAFRCIYPPREPEPLDRLFAFA